MNLSVGNSRRSKPGFSTRVLALGLIVLGAISVAYLFESLCCRSSMLPGHVNFAYSCDVLRMHHLCPVLSMRVDQVVRIAFGFQSRAFFMVVYLKNIILNIWKMIPLIWNVWIAEILQVLQLVTEFICEFPFSFVER
jgi:hypothetical protein